MTSIQIANVKSALATRLKNELIDLKESNVYAINTADLIDHLFDTFVIKEMTLEEIINDISDKKDWPEIQ